MDTSKSISSSSGKELRFVTSAEQIIPFLRGIRETSQSSDDQNAIDTNASDLNDDMSKSVPKSQSSNHLAPAKVPNIYEEYVNFIDLSVLNPIVDANNCQRDTLIESEISEQRFLFP